MTLLAMTSVLTGAALSRWFRVLVLVPLALAMLLVCCGAAVAGVLTLGTALLCAFIEMAAMQFGFLAGLLIQSRVRLRKKKHLAAI